MQRVLLTVLAGLGAGAIGCASSIPPVTTPRPGHATPAGQGGQVNNSTTAFPSTYEPLPSHPVVLRNATVMTASGPTLEHASVVMDSGRIVAVGTSVPTPPGAEIVDATGKWVTPGLIDTHSHLGVYPAPGGSSLSDGNEATSPNTAEVWAEHSIWPQDPQFGLALAGGVTTLEILPGSANLFGGRGVVVRNVP